jgi:hypothetical protein
MTLLLSKPRLAMKFAPMDMATMTGPLFQDEGYDGVHKQMSK